MSIGAYSKLITFEKSITSRLAQPETFRLCLLISYINFDSPQTVHTSAIGKDAMASQNDGPSILPFMLKPGSGLSNEAFYWRVYSNVKAQEKFYMISCFDWLVT